jgi:hypothetical protein
MEYFSDASMSGSESETEEEESTYCPRELDYWAIEELLESRGPPPVIEYVAQMGVVALRSIVVAPSKYRISQVVDAMSVHSWQHYWRGRPIDKTALFSGEDWFAIGEFCMQLCECCVTEPSAVQVRRCMLHVLHCGNFKVVRS